MNSYRIGIISLLVVLSFVFCAAPVHAETTRDQIEFANGLFHRGFHSEAIEEYERYLSETPDGADALLAWLRMGRSAIIIGRYDKALRAFQQAEAKAETLEQRLDAQVSQGEALFFLKRYADAISILQAPSEGGALETRARALYYLGRAHLESNDNESAVAIFNTLVTELPDSSLVPFAQYHLGFALIEANDMEGAATAFSAAANAPGADANLRMESRFRAAELYDKLGWTAAALGAYEQLRAEFPDSEYARRADYGYAWALYHSGQYEDALNMARDFIKEYPEAPHAPGFEYLRGNCLYQLRRYEDALRIYSALREQFQDSAFAARALYKIAWTRYLMNATAEAREAILTFLDIHADSELYGDALYLLGTIRVAEGDYEEALKEFRLVAEKYPAGEFSADALFKAGECYAQLGLRNEAARTFEEFARRYPGNPLTEEAMLRSGDARFTAEDFAEALKNYERILEAPGDARIEEETLYRLAVTNHNLKQYDESVAAFQRLLDKFPGGQHAAEAYFRIGEHQLRLGKDPLQAIEAYQAALEAEPDGMFAVRAKQGLAAARFEQKDYKQAAEQILELLREHPETPLSEDAYLWCGQWLREQERWDAAAIVYDAVLASSPEHEERGALLFMLAECREKEGSADKAIEAYAKALEMAPEPQRAAEIQYRMGRLYEARDEADKALALYEAAANLDGGEASARARFQLGAVQETLGNHESAARNYMRLAILYVHETLSPEALWRAGNCYQRLGNDSQAISVFKELIEDYPDSSFARQAREVIETATSETTAE
ncbi:MAG TPA: tetratricopeptide repeat protein [Candidatus Hydrogenedentes bacterium]|nr:tetratricopeptide repeat protein [Candidatus Hydrogenedentota bacterium]